MSWLIEKGGNI